MAVMLEGKSVMALMAILVMIGACVVEAQTDCLTLITSLSPCLGYVTGSGNSPPSTTCCTAFASVVTSNVTCVCEVLNNNSAIPNFNQTTAMRLPNACNVVIPTINGCQQTVAEVPAGGPSTSSVPPPIEGGTPNSGPLFSPSVVTIVSMVGVIMMKTLG
ncbi:hypothetical protein KI387_033207 [Taxus chinensis]|uniref:Bifunctional inhibitor/plant lipid transfer protein/seed storage helical domain-containing protein n=1 Tax=Taxus chinensis TaxID=29808 RepID=A0AA38F4V4_TAXCH|nr:hypothetical protein KI387_033207 [Taxus chinensis]